jgi:hypothetical protein
MHRHHLGIDAHAIVTVGVEAVRDLDKRKRRRELGVEIVTD